MKSSVSKNQTAQDTVIKNNDENDAKKASQITNNVRRFKNHVKIVSSVVIRLEFFVKAVPLPRMVSCGSID